MKQDTRGWPMPGPGPASLRTTMPNPEKSPTPEQRASNRRLAFILATIALVFFLGVIFKRVVFGG
ncbi:hypothetical protein MAFF211271_28430 [Ralstonia syzygii subsp. indonesiensis]|nr:hypothetical protein MAFF211271_28430 [Ralstonia pseudosolanacearum]